MVPELTIRKTSPDEFSRCESYWACCAGCCSVSCGETHPGESRLPCWTAACSKSSSLLLPWPSSGRQPVTMCVFNRSGWAQHLQSLRWKRKGLPRGSLHAETTSSCTENGPEGRTRGRPREPGWNSDHLQSLQPRCGPCISKAEGLSWVCGSSEQIPVSHKHTERDLFGQLHQLLHGKGSGGMYRDQQNDQAAVLPVQGGLGLDSVWGWRANQTPGRRAGFTAGWALLQRWRRMLPGSRAGRQVLPKQEQVWVAGGVLPLGGTGLPGLVLHVPCAREAQGHPRSHARQYCQGGAKMLPLGQGCATAICHQYWQLPAHKRHAGKLPLCKKWTERGGQCVHKLSVNHWLMAVALCMPAPEAAWGSALPLSLFLHAVPSTPLFPTFPSTHHIPLAPAEARLSQSLQVLKQQDVPARKMGL